jgi:hypothetical protein
MTNSPDYLLPKHLEDLLAPTLLGLTKLITAWDSLSSESQIQILSKITDEKSGYPESLLSDVRIKAFSSPSPYVRYLATKGFSFYESDKEDTEKAKFNQLIENDPSPLVKFSKTSLNLSINAFGEPLERFFKLPQVARLTSISNIEYGVASELVEVLKHGIKKNTEGALTDEELYYLVDEFINKKEFDNKFNPSNPSRGSSLYLAGKRLETLWRLTAEVPEGVSYPLIKNLPTESGLSGGIPEEVLKQFNKDQLGVLFERPDVDLLKFRKKFFQENLNDDSLGLWAAIGHNFDLTNEEFSEILKKPPEEKEKILSLLSQACKDLRLCVVQGCTEGNYSSVISEEMEHRYKGLDRLNRDKEITELRLYDMAKVSTVPYDTVIFLPSQQGCGNDELKAFDEIVVKGDTWETFMAFSDAWEKLNYKEQDELKKYLPSVLDGIHETEEDSEEKPSIEASLVEAYLDLKKDLKSIEGNQSRIETYLGSIVVFIFICLIIFLCF